MKLSHFFIFLFLFMLSSCAKEEDPNPNGDITLSSRFYGTNVYFVYGFSFELEESVPSLNSGGKIYDIIPVNILEASTGNAIGSQFSVEGSNQNGLLLNDQFETLSEAESFFMNYTNATNGPWQDLSDTIKSFQVYTYKTHQNNFVKFYTKDVRIIKSELEDEKDYIEIDIHYYIQRDGSSVFAE
jgi:hypothetical protein